MFQVKNNTVQLLIKSQMWGPLLVGLGAVSLSTANQSQGAIVLASRVSIASLLVIAGLLVMLIQLWPRNVVPLDEHANDTSIEAFGRLVRQLAQNYNLLRRQTVQGFVITLVLMTLGVVVIIVGVFGALVAGIASDTKLISALAGAITEVIAGSTLLVYRLNFKRLNDVSDRLEETWRILCAHSLAGSLPPEKQADATLMLISALVCGAARVSHTESKL
ncbi:MAG: hypothetical protein ABSF26_24080 [Thermoguttaceae bacterium]|jgi:hypothetical protein